MSRGGRPTHRPNWLANAAPVDAIGPLSSGRTAKPKRQRRGQHGAIGVCGRNIVLTASHHVADFVEAMLYVAFQAIPLQSHGEQNAGDRYR